MPASFSASAVAASLVMPPPPPPPPRVGVASPPEEADVRGFGAAAVAWCAESDVMCAVSSEYSPTQPQPVTVQRMRRRPRTRHASGEAICSRPAPWRGSSSTLHVGQLGFVSNQSCRHAVQKTCAHVVRSGASTRLRQTVHVNSAACCSWPSTIWVSLKPMATAARRRLRMWLDDSLTS